MPGSFYGKQWLAKAELIGDDGSTPGKAEPISVGSSTPGMMYLIPEKCYRAETIVAREDQNEICHSDNSSETKVSEGGRMEVLQELEQRLPCSPC